ncbi:MarR family transcriptional regulator [Microbacteriaceae bacterium VKM Ac-2854]|nr:MarR family transcriptional regulator [Microbacteriaceae bacterium VKM Ac-2854]
MNNVSRLANATNSLTRYASLEAGGSQSAAVWHALAELQQRGSVRLGELARNVRVSQPSMTAIVSRLEELGWGTRAPDPSDGRAWLVEGTDAGFAALDDWRRRIDIAMQPLFADLADDERDTIARAVGIIESRLASIRPATPRQKGATS